MSSKNKKRNVPGNYYARRMIKEGTGFTRIIPNKKKHSSGSYDDYSEVEDFSGLTDDLEDVDINAGVFSYNESFIKDYVNDKQSLLSEKVITIKTTEGTIKEWWLGEDLHRIDGPAVECSDGSEEWFVKGICHREDGPAATRRNGNKEWWINGFLHREGAPAIEYKNGDKFYYLHGEPHRNDGPAQEYHDGRKVWCLNGVIIAVNSQKEFDDYKKTLILK